MNTYGARIHYKNKLLLINIKYINLIINSLFQFFIYLYNEPSFFIR